MKTIKYFTCIAFLAVSGSALAFTTTFVTGSGATDSAGEPVNAQVVFTTSANSLSITLTNLIVNQKSAGQLVSDLFFSLAGSNAAGGTITADGPDALINVPKGAPHTPTSAGSGPSGWTLSFSAGVFHLNGLGAAAFVPSHLIIGAPDGSGNYSNANSSIAGNGPHNPFIDQTATWTISIPGISAGTFVTSATFSFGTTPGDTAGGGGHCTSGCGENVPDGGTTSLLLGFALTGLGVLRRYLKA